MTGETSGINRRPTVAQQQRACITLCLRLGDGLVETDDAMWPEADVAVRVDQTRNDPATNPISTENSLCSGNRLGREDAVDDPPFDRLTIGKSSTADVQNRQHC